MKDIIYYNFLSSKDAIDDLENEWIKVSTLNELNDPFELRPYLKYEFEERQPYHKVHRIISKKWGFLCFSDGWKDPILWSYYADKHRGIAIGFNILQYGVLKVSYSSNPERQKIKLTNDKNKDEKLFLGLAKMKYKKWEYEKEYRVLVKLKDCIPKEYLPKEKLDLLLIRFRDKLKVKKIILGCRFDHENNKEKIVKLAIKLNSEIIPTRKEWKGYKILKSGKWAIKYKKLISSMKLYK